MCLGCQNCCMPKNSGGMYVISTSRISIIFTQSPGEVALVIHISVSKVWLLIAAPIECALLAPSSPAVIEKKVSSPARSGSDTYVPVFVVVSQLAGSGEWEIRSPSEP